MRSIGKRDLYAHEVFGASEHCTIKTSLDPASPPEPAINGPYMGCSVEFVEHKFPMPIFAEAVRVEMMKDFGNYRARPAFTHNCDLMYFVALLLWDLATEAQRAEMMVPGTMAGCFICDTCLHICLIMDFEKMAQFIEDMGLCLFCVEVPDAVDPNIPPWDYSYTPYRIPHVEPEGKQDCLVLLPIDAPGDAQLFVFDANRKFL
jgi:hypothetical protein